MHASYAVRSDLLLTIRNAILTKYGVDVEPFFKIDLSNKKRALRWIPVHEYMDSMDAICKVIPVTIYDWIDIAAEYSADPSNIYRNYLKRFVGVRQFFTILPLISRAVSTYVATELLELTSKSALVRTIVEPGYAALSSGHTFFYQSGMMRSYFTVSGTPCILRILRNQADFRALIERFYARYNFTLSVEKDSYLINGEPIANIDPKSGEVKILHDLVVDGKTLLRKSEIYNARCSLFYFQWNFTESLLSSFKALKRKLSNDELTDMFISTMHEVIIDTQPSDEKDEVQKPAEKSSLSQRESEVLAYLLEGLTKKEIAERLNISLSTVKRHTESIYDKESVNARYKLFLKHMR